MLFCILLVDVCQILSDRDRLVRRTRVIRDAEAAEIKVTSQFIVWLAASSLALFVLHALTLCQCTSHILLLDLCKV